MLACAAADDGTALDGIAAAEREGLATAILVGDRAGITALVRARNLPLTELHIEHVPDPIEACRVAVDLCRQGVTQALMKGRTSTATFLGAVLDAQRGVRGDGALSHVTVFQPVGAGRLLLLADAGVNIAPDVARKIDIIRNTVGLAARLGIPRPKVALLAAIEQEKAQMPATVEAAEIVRWAREAPFADCEVGGPYSLDLAVSPEAVRQKGLDDPIAGHADILIAPDIEAGNVLYKALTCFASLELASLVLGASVPLIVPSRADSGSTKRFSIALAAYLARPVGPG